MSGQPQVDAAVARRNSALGLGLGAAVLGLLVIFMILFSRHGLPKDPKVVKEQQRAERAGAPR